MGARPLHTLVEPPPCPLTPSQDQWDRLLVLYPTSLAIFSEEADGLCFKVGPSPLWTHPGNALFVGVGEGSGSGGTCISGPVETEC